MFLKKLIQYFVVLFAFFIVAVTTSVNAQNAVPNPVGGLLQGSSDIAGITCGDATNPVANRCCKTVEIIDPTGDLIPEFACLKIPNPVGGDPKLCLSSLVEGAAKVVTKIVGLEKVLEASRKASNLNPCTVGVPEGDPTSASCTCKEKETTSQVLCDHYVTNPSELKSCISCANKLGVWTGLGCMQTNKVSTFISSTVLSLGFGIAGSVSFLCILYAAFILQTSRGNPERIKKARENIRACITGLLLVIFSVFILRLIGVEILRLPGFN